MKEERNGQRVLLRRGHPHEDKSGVVVATDEPLSLSFLGSMDRIKLDDGQECYAKPEQYRIIGYF